MNINFKGPAKSPAHQLFRDASEWVMEIVSESWDDSCASMAVQLGIEPKLVRVIVDNVSKGNIDSLMAAPSYNTGLQLSKAAIFTAIGIGIYLERMHNNPAQNQTVN